MKTAEEILDNLERNHPSYNPDWTGEKSYGREFVIGAINKALNIANVVGRSEPCGLLHSTDWNGKCFECGEQVFVREPK